MKIGVFLVLSLLIFAACALRSRKRKAKKGINYPGDSWTDMCLYGQGRGWAAGFLRLHDQSDLMAEDRCLSDEKWDILKQTNGRYCIKWHHADLYISHWDGNLFITDHCLEGEEWIIERSGDEWGIGDYLTLKIPGSNLRPVLRGYTWWFTYYRELHLTTDVSYTWTMSKDDWKNK